MLEPHDLFIKFVLLNYTTKRFAISTMQQNTQWKMGTETKKDG